MNPTLVTASFVAQRVDARDVLIFDVTLPHGVPRERIAYSFTYSHVKSAVYLLLTAETSTSLLSLPTPSLLQLLMNETQFEHGKALILYDDDSVSALRAWWLFQSYNFYNVSVMNCSFGEYYGLGLPVESGPARRARRPRHARFFAAVKLPLLLTDYELERYQILARRSPGIVLYDAEEHRVYYHLYDAEGHLQTDVFYIRQLITYEKLDPTAHIIVSCNALKNGILVIFALFMTYGEYPRASIHLKADADARTADSTPGSAV